MNPYVIMVGLPAAATALSLGIGYGLHRLTTKGSPKLKARYASGNETPSILSGEWTTYGGARPELRGSPSNTILAVKGLAKRSPEFRARLLDVAELSGFPVDTLAVVMASESGLDPAALNPLPAAGLLQWTVGAHMPGLSSADKIRELISWTAERQLEELVVPYLARFQIKTPPSPGRFYMMNFLPNFASSPDETVIGKRNDVDSSGKPTFSSKVYDWNRGFDQGNTGVITVGNVKEMARRVARAAKGARMTVDGRIIAEHGAAAGAATSVKHSVTKTLHRQTEKAPEGARWPEESAGGLLLDAVRRGTATMPVWRKVQWNGLEVETFADALNANVAIAYTATDFAENARFRNMLRVAQIAPIGAGQVGAKTFAIRLPCSYIEQIEIARKLGAVSLVAGLWDACFAQAQIKLTPTPLPPDQYMASIGASLHHSMLIDNEISASGALVRDVGKGWILHPRLAERGAVNYGWIQLTTSTPIQGIGATHGPTHFDYSQTCVLARRFARKISTGEQVDLLNVYEALGIERRWLDVYR